MPPLPGRGRNEQPGTQAGELSPAPLGASVQLNAGKGPQGDLAWGAGGPQAQRLSSAGREGQERPGGRHCLCEVPEGKAVDVAKVAD